MKKLTSELIARSYPEAEFNYNPETETITWINNKISDAQITELIAEYDAQEYARNRQDEYPPMADQLDYMFHNGFNKWKEDIVQPVKDKYPKPE